MKTNVSTLLREFPKIRRAVLSGEDVIVQTREGNLRITADRAVHESVLGSRPGKIKVNGDLTRPTSEAGDWEKGE